MDTEHLEIVREFIAESRDILETLDPCLMEVERAIEDNEEFSIDIVHQIFRGFHSLKGAASYLEMATIANLTHHAESLLDLFRKGKAELKSNHLELFYQAGDLLKELLNIAEETLSDNGLQDEVEKLVTRFKAVMPGSSEPQVVVSSAAADMGMSPEDCNEIMDHSIELLSKCVTCFEQLGDNPDEALKNLMRDMGGITGQLDILGHSDLSIASRKVVMLVEKLLANNTYDDKNLMGLLQRLVEGLLAAVKGVREGKSGDYGITLMTLMDELIKVETGGEISSEGQILLGDTLVKLGVITKDELKVALSQQNKPLGEILVDMNALSAEQLEVGLKLQNQKLRTQKKQSASDLAHSIRVDLGKLDLLGNLVGELVIAENMVTHHESVIGEGFTSFKKAAMVLNRISREIQDLVMSLRMVPIHGTFQKMTRVVRDVSHKVGKRVDIETTGNDTEIDKNVIENLSSPLVHIIRNAVDHGIESCEDREAAGKDPVGKIVLSASQEGGEIVIRIKDDGGGMDPDRILQKAWEKGVYPEGERPEQKHQIYELIMMPGFSTVSQVTEFSGRGVGMDVVKQNIESLQGQIHIDSVLGKGSTFTLRIPLTLSIIEGMLVRVGRAILTIPLLNIRETLIVGDRVITTSIDGTQTIKIRDTLIPIIRLYDYFGFEDAKIPINDGILVVVEYGRQQVCLLVDEMLGQRQTVIKKISAFFDEIKGISGFSILSNGDITLVVDIGHMATLGHIK